MKEVSVGGVLVEGVDIIHDSTKEIFRNPPGAVVCGTEVSLALKVSRLQAERAALCILRDEMIERYDLYPEGGMLRACYTVPEAGEGGGCVLWYWFEITLQGGAICYYGAEPPYMSGLGHIYLNPPPAFQLTVYDAGFSTPDWAKSAVMYQIFPDRFFMGDPGSVRAGVEYHRNKGRAEIELHENWDDTPVYEAKSGQKYYMPGDIFGGDLEGIRQKLPYLQSLGVTLLYLNPIFEASSNHRYNTGDYLKIDPILGDVEAFRRLVCEAKKAGIRIVLDGVFSHTGDDSIYFNKYGRYESSGAYQSEDSPYFSWYKFDVHPDRYVSWWGFESLPEVNEHDPGWQEFVITGRDSVVKHWLGEGAAGYRFDVADELPDLTIEQLRSAVKEADSEAFLLGEVWEDATTKQSYGKQRSYTLGRGLDSVMNYPFLNKTIDFLKGRIDAWHYAGFLENQRHNYPAPMYYTLMNLLSSHDVCRVRSLLSVRSEDFDPGGMNRAEQARFELSAEEYEYGGLLQRLAAAIQFSLPGIPAVYYGDEAGMTGLLDPFNRRTYRVEDPSIGEWYMWLGGLRNGRPVMRTGHVRFFSTNGNVLGILRYSVDGFDFFDNEIGVDAVLTVVNPTDESHRIVLDLNDMSEQLSEDGTSGTGDNAVYHSGPNSPQSLQDMDPESLPVSSVEHGSVAPAPGLIPLIPASHNYEDALTAVNLRTGLRLPIEKSLVEIDIPPLSAEIFELL